MPSVIKTSANVKAFTLHNFEKAFSMKNDLLNIVRFIYLLISEDTLISPEQSSDLDAPPPENQAIVRFQHI